MIKYHRFTRFRKGYRKILTRFNQLSNDFFLLKDNIQATYNGLSLRLPLQPEIIQKIIWNALSYTKSLEFQQSQYGQYLYKKGGETVLYASVFSALLRDLLNDLDNLPEDVRFQWSEYIKLHQSPDGLFRDPKVQNQIAESEDWWGWRHLTLLSLMALVALNTKPPYRLIWLDHYPNSNSLLGWLDSLNWNECVDFTSNAVQNRVACMQYARDFLYEHQYSIQIEQTLDYLQNKCNPKTGLWGDCPVTSKMITTQVQAAYHFWLLFVYDGIRIPYFDNAIEYILQTQSHFGGYSPIYKYSSACEDIDSIDPLIRYNILQKGSQDKITYSINKAMPWIMLNFDRNGGASFRRNSPFTYGHALMSTNSGESSIFSTWFRILSIALIDSTYQNIDNQKFKWNFLKSPGYQISPADLFPSPRFNNARAIFTHLTDEEKYYLFNIARNLESGSIIVEIGSYLGASVSFMAEGCKYKIKKIYCIDTWKNDAMSEGPRNTFDEFITNTIPYESIIETIQGRSDEIAKEFSYPINLLFIDANHEYEEVIMDLKCWIPKIITGGWLVMHDYGWAEGVRQAIEEIVIPIQLENPIILPNLYATRVLPDMLPKYQCLS